MSHFWISVERKKCLHCPQTFYDNLYLKKHCQEAHKDAFEKEWVTCKDCGKKFHSKLSLIIHKNRLHKVDLANSFSRKYFCTFCQKSFVHAQHHHDSSLTNHCNANHLDEVSKIWKLCDVCGCYVPQKFMMIHKENKHRRKQCHICLKMMAKSQYFSHFNFNHKAGSYGN